MPYPKCDHIKRSKPVFEVNEELAKELALKAQILPLFEKGLFEHSFIKNYSLRTNDLLKCRWGEYVQNIESRVFAPFQFPDIKDFHFYNHDVRMYREGSIKYRDHRNRLKPGPGVDYGGQMPIPQELLMKRGTAVKSNEKGVRGKKMLEKRDGNKVESKKTRRINL